jgi:hypothetical protein
MIELLAALSASAAAGMRIALPLLVIGLVYGEAFWSEVSGLSHTALSVILGVLVVWSLAEVVFSKDPIGRRVVLLVQLVFSPFVGAIMGMAVARAAGVPTWLVCLLGGVGGLLALVLQLVQIGWSYRLRRIPIWVIFVQDTLCVLLVLFAFDAPSHGGLIALLLLWLAIRSSKEWYRWYRSQASSKASNPRRYKRNPD